MTVLHMAVRTCAVFLSLVCAGLSSACAEGAARNPPEAFAQTGEFARERAEVLVLGTAHLSGWPESEPGWFAPLNDALAGWAPDSILIERPTAWQAELYAHQEERFAATARRTLGAEIGAARQAQSVLQLSAYSAEAEIRSEAAASLDDVRLTLLLMAAFDAHSAAMRWSRLAAAQQQTLSDRAPMAAQVISQTAASRNETQWIAANVALRLDHVRLHPFDDQIEKAAFASTGLIETLAEDGRLEAVLSTQMLERLHADQARRPNHANAVLDWYRHINSPEFTRLDAEGQWGSFLAEGGEEGRQRVALWEARNLRMAANIREIMALEGGGRILVVVGSAHKAWLETYLRRQSDVDLVALDDILVPH